MALKFITISHIESDCLNFSMLLELSDGLLSNDWNPDHHCVFIGNCVSFLNVKFFVAFIIYACIGCTFVAITAFPAMSRILFEPFPSTVKADAHFGNRKMSSGMESAAIIGWILCVTFSFALTFFVAFHAYLVTRGKTTIELYDTSDPERSARIAEYNVGASRNWRLVCGNVPFCWLFPVRAFIDGDGLDWPRNTLPDIPGLPEEV